MSKITSKLKQTTSSFIGYITGEGTLRNIFLMIKEEPLYSLMYIAGTALAIAFVMLIAEVYYVKVADIEPEVRRSQTYYMDFMGLRSGGDEGEVAGISQEVFRDLLQTMQTPECVTGVVNLSMFAQHHMKLADGIHDRDVKVTATEPGYFDFYRYHFIEGRPFTQDDFDSRRRMCVVTEEVWRQTSSGSLALDNRLYRIIGVIETPSVLTEKSFPNIIVPWTAEGLFALQD